MNELFQDIEIIPKGDGTYRAVALLNTEHLIFKAHFPGFPILPGVMMLRFFRELAVIVSGRKTDLVSASNVKFIHPVFPGKHRTVEAEFQMADDGETITIHGKLFYGAENVAKMEGLKYRKL